MQKKFRIENSTCPIEFRDAVCQSSVDSDLSNPCIFRNNGNVDFNEKVPKMFDLLK